VDHLESRLLPAAVEAVDVPEAEVCMVARGCQHAGPWLQMVGRVMRPAPGKTSALVLDLAGASHRHGLPGEDCVYSLDGRAIRPKVEPLRVCQQCGMCYPSADGACPDCGFAPTPKPQRVRIWDMDLEEAEAAATTSKERGVVNWRKRWSTASEAECCAEYRRLAQMAAEKGYKPGWAKYQMKLKTGRWPRAGW
jgi:superfamily II DNA or RNA helicase